MCDDRSVPELTELSVPDEWSTLDEEVDSALTESAKMALADMEKVEGSDPAVKTILAKFVADWKDVLAANPDLAETLAGDRVKSYFGELTRASNSGLCPSEVWHEINMGMHESTLVEEGDFIDKAAESAGVTVETMRRVAQAMVEEIRAQLAATGRAKLLGFGSFFITNRTVHDSEGKVELRKTVDFRCSTSVKRSFTTGTDHVPAGLAVSPFGQALQKRLGNDVEQAGQLLEKLIATLLRILDSQDGSSAVAIDELGTFSRRKLRRAYSEKRPGVSEELPPSYSVAFLVAPRLMTD